VPDGVHLASAGTPERVSAADLGVLEGGSDVRNTARGAVAENVLDPDHLLPQIGGCASSRYRGPQLWIHTMSSSS
jgi:hypothetical protein